MAANLRKPMVIYNPNVECVYTIWSHSSQFVLKILSKKTNSDVKQGTLICCKFAKNNDYNLVTDNVYTKFGLILTIYSQDIEHKPNSDVNQGP